MKKNIVIIILLILWASPVSAQQATGDRGETKPDSEIFATRIGLGWYGIKNDGNTVAGEYDYLKSSAAGALDLEWDPLPHRFVLESYYLNSKDYFGEVDYSFKDIVVLNGYARDLFHNLNHYSFAAEMSPPSVDLNPDDVYGIENQLRRGFIRLKTPDFPFHLYADTRTINREGTIQQRFFSSSIEKTSQSREVDWNTREYRVGINSHLGPIEADYSHTEKKFEPFDEKVLFDASSGSPVAHNLVPDLKSSSDSVKVHTGYSGKVVIAGTWTDGERKNEDSGAKATFTNTAGDIMVMPVTSLIFTLKYRHYDLDVTNTPTVNTVTGIQPMNVRDSISSDRDVVSGILRYRLTDRLTLRGEYTNDTTDRTRGELGTTVGTSDFPAFWTLPKSTTKNTAKLAISYRILNKMTFRADYSEMKVDNPAYDTDPDKASNARASLTWILTPRFNTMLSYGTVREKRDGLSAPLAGGTREAARNQALASATMMIGTRSSITASYAYYRNKVEQTLTLQDGIGAFALDSDVPYADTSHVGSLLLTFAPRNSINLVGSISKSYSRGNFRIAGAGTVTNVSGIAELSDLKVIDTIYTAGIEIQNTRYMTSELRYEHRNYDDRIDDTQDGKAESVLATVSLKW